MRQPNSQEERFHPQGTKAEELPNDRNIEFVVLGDIGFKTSYPSYYPEALVGKEHATLYVCQWCFKYTTDAHLAITHRRLCESRRDIPGRLVYEYESLAIYEVDGEEDQLFAQNMSLFAKLFLDNKSVFFDVSSFNYHILVVNSANSANSVDASQSASSSPPCNSSRQIIGFFSKEKLSWDNNNLACILVFPPWQRKGLGQVLMGVSYSLSRAEGRFGGPEKPLSKLGSRGYMQFWETSIARHILLIKGRRTMTVEELAQDCWILSKDVIATLKRMAVLSSPRKDGSLSVTKRAIRDWAVANQIDLAAPIFEAGVYHSIKESDRENSG